MRPGNRACIQVCARNTDPDPCSKSLRSRFCFHLDLYVSFCRRRSGKAQKWKFMIGTCIAQRKWRERQVRVQMLVPNTQQALIQNQIIDPKLTRSTLRSFPRTHHHPVVANGTGIQVASHARVRPLRDHIYDMSPVQLTCTGTRDAKKSNIHVIKARRARVWTCERRCVCLVTTLVATNRAKRTDRGIDESTPYFLRGNDYRIAW